MAVRPVVICGEPVLHRPAARVEAFDEALAELVTDLFDTMDAAHGVGLAAPQIGVGRRLFTYELANDDGVPARGVVVNPILTVGRIPDVRPDRDDDEEGCLSVPGESFPLVRADRVRVQGFTAWGDPLDFEATGWFARCMQHEFDHLNGKLYVDRLDGRWAKKAKKAVRANGWGTPGLSWMPGVDTDPFGHDEHDEHGHDDQGTTIAWSDDAVRRPPAGVVVVVAVVGPTATGKSDLALDLAQRLDGEVVGADAMQLYRGMDIGTAKLDVTERRGIPHHQLDVLDVRDEASVATYQREARADLDALQERGRRAVLVGGSGLYVRAALDRLEIPPTDPAVRARLAAELEQDGLPALRARLQRLDPAAAAAIEPRNGRRLVRALEVVELTGRPFSATLPTRELARPTVVLGLRADRTTLDARIDARVERMWETGLLTEVEALLAQGLREGRTASRAIGYAQAVAQLDGHLTGAQARAETAAGTRRLARRQASWFGPDPRVVWLAHDAPDLLDRALAEVAEADTALKAASV